MDSVRRLFRCIKTGVEVAVHVAIDPISGRKIWAEDSGQVIGEVFGTDPHPGYEFVDPMEGYDYRKLCDQIYEAQESLRVISEGPGVVLEGRLNKETEDELLAALADIGATVAFANLYISQGRAERRERDARAKHVEA
jgi:hypothetical protein